MKTHQQRSNGARKQVLVEIQNTIQSFWEEQNVYNVESNFGQEKFFCTFPYPYMNGLLHLGHAFTMMKSEFQARFQRLQGKNVLWPLGFHCSGMPIRACADKLQLEIDEMNKIDAEEINSSANVTVNDQEQTSFLMQEVYKAKKNKVAAKIGASKLQWDILASCNIPESEIPKFQDPQHWLNYFPKLAMEDLKKLGLSIDWRRSFITTDRNLYYDAFVRWQFNTLYKKGCIKFGIRPTIFSIASQQPCADHERASGESVMHQEFVLIKLEVERKNDTKLLQDVIHASDDNRIFLVAATVRPETMFGQTNCFVLPDGVYGLYIAFSKVSSTTEQCGTRSGTVCRHLSRSEALSSCRDYFICSERSAWNMAYQGIIPLDKDTKKPILLCECRGTDLIGLSVKAPCSIYQTVFVLPMLTVSLEKGTGIVTSVPSDSPDDYAALRDLREKPTLRDKYKVTENMLRLEPVDLIETPFYGKQSAAELCKKYHVKSQNDTAALKLAKEESYKKAFYEGIMLIDPYKGEKVMSAKPKITQYLLQNSFALIYFEPEKPVISRSGDSCVVALCDQWYIDYANAEWKKVVNEHASNPKQFETFPAAALSQIQHVIFWLKEWACSRQYGLGTYIPWEKEKSVLIESLSDSSIYMAYYTVSHLLQGNMYGDITGPFKITSDQLTDSVFDYIFALSKELPHDSKIPHEKLKKLRKDFEYWYPMDLRSSGKDLIFNHLTMSLFIHCAIWENLQKFWPRSFECNGMVLVDSQKMSKSVGNFLTISESVELFTADATRMALADAGDSMDDANFQKDTANSALMRLYVLHQFVTKRANKSFELRVENYPFTWEDGVFFDEIYTLIKQAEQAYLRMEYRSVLKYAFYDFIAARDQYKILCGDKLMNTTLVDFWIETATVIMSPILPHLCEYFWSFLLKKEKSVVFAKWPQFSPQGTSLLYFNDKENSLSFDAVRHEEYAALRSFLEEFRRVKEQTFDSKKTKKLDTAGLSAVIYVARSYNPLQCEVLKILQSIPLDSTETKPADDDFMVQIKKSLLNNAKQNEKDLSEALSFASYRVKICLPRYGRAAFEMQNPFDEEALFRYTRPYIQRQLGLQSLTVLKNTDEKHLSDRTNRINLASPSKPSIVFWIA